MVRFTVRLDGVGVSGNHEELNGVDHGIYRLCSQTLDQYTRDRPH